MTALFLSASLRWARRWGTVLVVACLGACSKPKSDAVATTPAPPPSAIATATPAPPALPVAPSGKMAHCPSTVLGAKNGYSGRAWRVAVVVTSADEGATKEIRARAAFLEASAKNDVSPVAHNGTGEGRVFGRCPIVMRNTKVASPR